MGFFFGFVAVAGAAKKGGGSATLYKRWAFVIALCISKTALNKELVQKQ